MPKKETGAESRTVDQTSTTELSASTLTAGADAVEALVQQRAAIVAQMENCSFTAGGDGAEDREKFDRLLADETHLAKRIQAIQQARGFRHEVQKTADNVERMDSRARHGWRASGSEGEKPSWTEAICEFLKAGGAYGLSERNRVYLDGAGLDAGLILPVVEVPSLRRRMAGPAPVRMRWPERLESRSLVPGDLTGDMESAAPWVTERYIGGAKATNHTPIVTEDGRPAPLPTVDDSANKGTIKSGDQALAGIDPTVGKRDLGAFEVQSGLLRVGARLIEQLRMVSAAELVERLLSERIEDAENDFLTVGTGTGQPWGFVSRSTRGVTLVAADPTAQEVVDLLHSLDAKHAQRSEWSMNWATVGAMKALAAPQDSVLKYEYSQVAGGVDILGGRPVVLNSAMDDTGTDNVPVVVGNMREFVIRTVGNPVLRRSEHRFFESGDTVFAVESQIDSDVMDTAAIKHMIYPL